MENETELEKAKADLIEARQLLIKRETAIEEAEKLIAESQEKQANQENAIALLRRELEGLRSLADHASVSEQQLLTEIEVLRSNENSKSQMLAEARDALNALRQTMLKREDELAASMKSQTEQEKNISALKREAENLRTQAGYALESEQQLLAEIEQLRSQENDKSQAFAQAQIELSALKQALIEREAAIAEAECENAEDKKVLAQSNTDLRRLRAQLDDAIRNTEVLMAEIEHLRSGENAKSLALQQAQAELNAWKQIAERFERLVRPTVLLSRSKEGRAALKEFQAVASGRTIE